jgi:hypothetical protein
MACHPAECGMRMTTLKSFRLYRSPGVVAPQRHVADYQPGELAQFRAEFRFVVERERQLGRLDLALLTLWLSCIVLGAVFLSNVPCFWWGLFAYWLVVLLFKSLSKAPMCPACHNALNEDLGAYCPECGAKAVQDGGWLSDKCCSYCGKTLWHGKARHYTIRACTQCGVPLDEKGF